MPEPEVDIGAQLHAIIIKHLEKIEGYEPAHGRSRQDRLAKDRLQAVFASDPLYSIFGLDSPEYIAATLGGGTITSIHRKIGDLYEESVREIFRLSLSLSEEDVHYSAEIASGDVRLKRSLDCFVPLGKLANSKRLEFQALAMEGFRFFGSEPKVNPIAIGIEVRHCYQSADSKRAQADEAMAMHCAISGILPLMLVFCNQSNRSILRRYSRLWYLREGLDSYSLVNQYTGFKFYDFLAERKETYRKYVIDALAKLR